MNATSMSGSGGTRYNTFQVKEFYDAGHAPSTALPSPAAAGSSGASAAATSSYAGMFNDLAADLDANDESNAQQFYTQRDALLFLIDVSATMYELDQNGKMPLATALESVVSVLSNKVKRKTKSKKKKKKKFFSIYYCCSIKILTIRLLQRQVIQLELFSIIQVKK